MNIAEVIGWKFNHRPGMRCEEIEGVLQIVEFPGGIPSQTEQDKWTAEYKAYIAEVARIKAIKTEARKRIISWLPGGAQDNYLEKESHLHAQYSALQDILLEGGTLTTEQTASKADLKDRFNKMDTIIAMSNSAEANGDSLDKFIGDLDAAGL